MEASLDHLTGTEALRLAGYGHRKARHLNPAKHDIFRLSDGVVVACLDAHEARDFAAIAAASRAEGV